MQIRGRRIDLIAALLFGLGVLLLLWTCRLNFRGTEANWDLLNYHSYVPAALLQGTWFTDFHPASFGTFLTPYQDLLWWPLISAAPAPIATAVIVAVEVSVFIPVGYIIRILAPALSTPRALGLGLIGSSGAMVASELGGTNGDVLPAILGVWALYLLLSVLAEQAPRPGLRASAAGALVGAAVVLKFTMALIAPGLLVFAVALLLARKPWCVVLFAGTAAAVALVLYAPWAYVLQSNEGSPMFPLYNAIFRAPRFPASNIQDARFPVTSLADLITLPVRQALGTAVTAETPVGDARWLVALLAVVVGFGTVLVRALRTRTEPRWRAHLPAITLVGFWVIAYVTWAVVFGIQRYAIILEVLALPVVVVGVSVARPHLPSRTSLLMLLVLVALLAGTTRIASFGRRTMTWAPLFPTETIQPIAKYDAIVIGSDPLAYLRAVTRDAPGSSAQVWLSGPFNDVDRAFGERQLLGKSVGVVFYTNARAAAVSVASNLGLQLTEDCQSFENPMSSRYMPTPVEICTAMPLR